MTIHDIITEIQNLNNEPSRKSVFEINRLLSNNKELIIKHIDADTINPLFKNFDSLSQASHKEYLSDNFTNEYQKQYNLLMYYFNKIS